MKLNSSIKNWAYYTEGNMMRLLVHLLLSCDKKGIVKTSRKKISDDIGLSIQEVRTLIDKLIRSLRINAKATSAGTIITIYKSEDYEF